MFLNGKLYLNSMICLARILWLVERTDHNQTDECADQVRRRVRRPSALPTAVNKYAAECPDQVHRQVR